MKKAGEMWLNHVETYPFRDFARGGRRDLKFSKHFKNMYFTKKWKKADGVAVSWDPKQVRNFIKLLSEGDNEIRNVNTIGTVFKGGDYAPLFEWCTTRTRPPRGGQPDAQMARRFHKDVAGKVVVIENKIKRLTDELTAKTAGKGKKLTKDNVEGVFADRTHRKIAEVVLELLGLIKKGEPDGWVLTDRATNAIDEADRNNCPELKVMIHNLTNMVNTGTPSPSLLDTRVWESIKNHPGGRGIRRAGGKEFKFGARTGTIHGALTFGKIFGIKFPPVVNLVHTCFHHMENIIT